MRNYYINIWIYVTKERLVPGFALEVQVIFKPTEYRYYSDAIKIYSEVIFFRYYVIDMNLNILWNRSSNGIFINMGPRVIVKNLRISETTIYGFDFFLGKTNGSKHLSI